MATTYKEVLEKPIWFLYITLLLASTFFFLLSYQSSRVPSHITSGVPLVLTIMAWLAWNRHPFCFIWWLLPCCAVRSPRSLQLVRETKLCTYCESILLASPLLNGTDSFLNLTSSTEWHDFRVQHRRAGADGVHGLACPLCTLLLDDTIMGLTKVKSSSSYGTFEIKKGTSRPILELKIWQPIRQEGRTFLQLYLSDQPISARFEIHEGPLARCTLVKNRRVATMSKQSMEIANSWLDRCSNEHSQCQRNSQFRPSRLLHLSSDGKSARLCSTANIEGCEPYAAVSHAWGSGVPFQLSLSNYDFLMKSFEVSILPPTFAQVCAIALELGYSFVWIDSLCIIQDSSADVRAELSTMANIYESAAVTLAATASEDSKGGCERSRDEYLHNECVLMVSASDRYHDRQCLYIAPEMWERRKDMSFNFFTKVDMAPLNQRAWVFQERLLSRRILHFGDGVLLFECNSMRATDIYHPGVEYDKEESFHANGRICTQTDTYYRHSPRYRFNNALSSLVDTFEARCLDAEVYDKTLIKFVVNTIYRMANTGISGDPYEFTKLHEITERLPNSIQNEVIKEWKALVYQYSSLTKDEAKEIYLPATVATAGRRGALDMLCSPCVNPQALTETEQLKRHRRWYELVSECSGRGITKRSDRLIAMSGLAQRIQKASGIEYYAGLWKSTLAYDLLWIRSKSTPRAKRRKEPSFAPSWSWASSAGKVESALVAVDIATEKRTDIMKYSKIQVDIIEVTVMMDGQQASGQETIIDAGRIRLRGWMKSVTLSEYPIVPDFDLRKKRMKYVCLVIFSQAKRGSYKGTWLGLLLERTSDTTHQYYERRGVVLVEEGICDWPEENGWRRKTITLI